MEGPAAPDGVDDEYMTMDADQWSEHDDTYENGDTLGLDLGKKQDSRGCESGPDSKVQKTEVVGKEKVATKRALENTQNPNTGQHPNSPPLHRYITIRRPQMDANRRPGNKPSPLLVFFRRTSACLLVLCLLLLGGLIGLSIYYGRLSVGHINEIEKVRNLLEEANNLLKDIKNATAKIAANKREFILSE